jgi:hypothetical protein
MKGPQMIQVINNARTIAQTKAFDVGLRAWSAELTAAIRQSVKDGMWARVANMRTVAKDELLGVVGKGMDGGARGALEAGLGGSAKELIDNLVAQALDDQIQNIIDGMLAGAPDAEELNGKWTASLTIQGLVGPEGDGAAPPPDAKTGTGADQGCDLGINLAELIGKTLPVTMRITLSPDGNGTAQLIGEGASGDGTAQYDRDSGRITIRMTQKAALLAMVGTAKRGPATDPKLPGPPVMSGTWTMTQDQKGLKGSWKARQ